MTSVGLYFSEVVWPSRRSRLAASGTFGKNRSGSPSCGTCARGGFDETVAFPRRNLVWTRQQDRFSGFYSRQTFDSLRVAGPILKRHNS
jgi:hypothetical protein